MQYNLCRISYILHKRQIHWWDLNVGFPTCKTKKATSQRLRGIGLGSPAIFWWRATSSIHSWWERTGELLGPLAFLHSQCTSDPWHWQGWFNESLNCICFQVWNSFQLSLIDCAPLPIWWNHRQCHVCICRNLFEENQKLINENWYLKNRYPFVIQLDWLEF